MTAWTSAIGTTPRLHAANQVVAVRSGIPIRRSLPGLAQLVMLTRVDSLWAPSSRHYEARP